MKSQAEIVRRIKAVRKGDIFNFEITELLPFLDHKRVMKVRGFNNEQLINPVTTAKLWKRMTPERSDDMVYKIMEKHIEKAWIAALNEKGISAQRNLIRYKVWFWLVGDDQMSEDIDDYLNYEWGEKKDFGKPMLVVISDKLKYDWRPVVRYAKQMKKKGTS